MGGQGKYRATRADAGRDSSNGYGYIGIDSKGYLGHRLAWLYMHGHFPDGLLDHKTRNPSSCRIADLRKATRSQNSANSRMQQMSPFACLENRQNQLEAHRSDRTHWRHRGGCG